MLDEEISLLQQLPVKNENILERIDAENSSEQYRKKKWYSLFPCIKYVRCFIRR